MHKAKTPHIAVLIPCHNEEVAIGKVVEDFKHELADAVIYVFDNCSTDNTANIAAEHGAEVVKEPRKGKGFVIESMFKKIKADYYIMVNGDNTYSVSHVRKLLEPLHEW